LPADKNQSMIEAFVFRDDKFLGTEIFTGRELLIGRDAGVHSLTLDSSSVSREHARVAVVDGDLCIEDLDSTNGIVVNGKRVQKAKLSRFDEISIGVFSLKFKWNDAKKRVKKARKTQALPESITQGSRLDNVRPEKTKIEPSKHQLKSDEESTAFGAQIGDVGALVTSDLGDMMLAPTDDRPPQQLTGSAFSVEHSMVVPPRLTPEDPSLYSEPDADDADEEDEEPSFSIRDVLLQQKIEAVGREVPGKAGQTKQIIGQVGYQVEVQHFSSSALEAVALVKRYHRYMQRFSFVPASDEKGKITSSRALIVDFRSPTTATVFYHESWKGMRYSGRDRIPVQGQELRFRKAWRKCQFKVDELLYFDLGGGACSTFRFVQPAAKQVVQRTHRNVALWKRPWVRLLHAGFPSPVGRRALGTSLMMHGCAALLMALAPVKDVTPRGVPGDFAEVVLEPKLELEKPVTQPELEPPAAVKAPPTPPPQAAPRRKPKKKAAARQAAPSNKTVRPRLKGGQSSAPRGILGLLSKRGSSAAPGSSTALAAARNIKASSASPRGGFRVSSLVSRAQSSDLRAGSGGGGFGKSGTRNLLRGGKGGAGRLRGGGGKRGVLGVVTKVPGSMKRAGRGSLNRDAIQKVINSGVGKIQRCYERQLLRQAGLAGKVQLEWTVATNGRVKSVRQIYSSLNSSQGVSCMMNVVRGWRFPSPKGGEVIVNYPFIFKAIAG
jgi:hypothetical protein